MSKINTLGIGLRGIVKRFEGSTALSGLDLSIEPGEFFSFLGPSGCGKTTALRIIAGFEAADEGRVFFGDRDVSDVPVHLRNIGMVFQSYALMPHRTVGQNVAFGLRMRGVRVEEIKKRVKRALEQVALGAFEDRMPSQLSGGQQQRVALARAVVIEPEILLCDEPFSALDRKLRMQMQIELRSLQKSLGITLLFVTHDQEEAMTMSDRIAVMHAGRIEQVGMPTEIYKEPRSLFVASFIGDMNVFIGDLPQFTNLPQRKALSSIAIRPEKISISTPSDHNLPAIVESVSYMGGSVVTRLSVSGGHEIVVRQSESRGFALPVVGSRVGLDWHAADVHVFDN
jgi:ABC-type Fe3+/spermidine/putrescine transport system ATPase subunit